MERLEDLLINGYKIYQDDELYCFTSDAILLSKFATVKKGDIVADFCSGSGIVGLHLFALNPNIKSVTLFEMQKPLYSLSKKSIEYNRLEKVFNAENVKVQDIDAKYNGLFSLIVCNPPYMENNRGFKPKVNDIAPCKQEVTLTLQELLKSVNKNLKYGGRFCMTNRADRLIDIIFEMRNNNIEPKKIQFVSPKNKPPYLVLIEGVKGGKSGLKVLPEINN